MWPNPQFPATFTEEILNEKLYFLCSAFQISMMEYFAKINVSS